MVELNRPDPSLTFYTSYGDLFILALILLWAKFIRGQEYTLSQLLPRDREIVVLVVLLAALSSLRSIHQSFGPERGRKYRVPTAEPFSGQLR